MKTKFFILNQQNQIEFTEKELKDLLDEIYNEGYRDGKKSQTYVYKTPWYYSPFPVYTTTTDSSTITINKGECPSSTACDTGNTTTTITSSISDALKKNKIKWTKSVSNNIND